MMTAILVSMLALTARLQVSGAVATTGGTEPAAVISVFNPTAWKGPLVVEIPTGSIAAPGLLNWRRVHLQMEHQTIPFAIRAGYAHARTPLVAPVPDPRAEDLLVFTCAIPPREWVRVQVLHGPSLDHEHTESLARMNGQCTIAYAGLKVVIDETTGLLQDLTFLDEALLCGPFRVEVTKLSEAVPYELVGAFGPGYADPADGNAPHIVVNRRGAVPYSVRLVSASSSAAMTEVNFLIEAGSGPRIALTYRIHANGVVDIVADGQPWQGDSPWCSHAVAYFLPLIGRPETIGHLEDRFPFYGFKGYTASVKQTACIRRGAHVGLLELGEEAVNGRRWTRRLIPHAVGDDAAVRSLMAAVDEGPIVEVLPARDALPAGGLRIECPESARAATDLLLKGLQAAGIKANTSAGNDAPAVLRLELISDPKDAGIEGDGFQIRRIVDKPGHRQEWSVRAGSLNGLYQASTTIAAHVSRFGASLPLIARNPVVPLRAGGFGGGNFEVDFPYGSEEEWKRTLENLAASGMNHFACLGMWGNWKMPVSYTYMPELRSSSPEAYDESSGARFIEFDQHRDRGLRLTRFLHDRGASVWLWIPIGCVPTTFVQSFPGAMAPNTEGGRSKKIPCFTHSDYRRYLDAFFRELLDTYPIQGLVLIRDDNGGLCTCDRCQAYVAASRTKSPAWEQYLVIYDLLRSKGFKGDVAVYPYFDNYAPRLDASLPKDLFVVGHGGEPAILTRDFDRVGLMGDTWLDNLYANFRLPSSPRMRRLLASRGSLWIGGAYCGTELPWESIGRFGWEPTATPNTLRYEWGVRTFGDDHAIAFVDMNQAYEHLWEINARYLPPAVWMKLGADTRQRVLEEGTACADLLRRRLAELKEKAGGTAHARWFGHVELFAPFIEYHLHRLDSFGRIHDLVLAHEEIIRRGDPLPNDVRQNILAWYQAIYDWAAKYDAGMKNAPEGMLTHCRRRTKPYKEWMAGYDQWLEPQLRVKQFAGTMRITTDAVKKGEALTLTVELHNLGCCPWIPDVGQELQLSGLAEQLGFPKVWAYEGDWMAPGDRRTIKLQGTVPGRPGNGSLKAAFTAPFRKPEKFITCEINMAWN